MTNKEHEKVLRRDHSVLKVLILNDMEVVVEGPSQRGLGLDGFGVKSVHQVQAEEQHHRHQDEHGELPQRCIASCGSGDTVISHPKKNSQEDERVTILIAEGVTFLFLFSFFFFFLFLFLFSFLFPSPNAMSKGMNEYATR